MEYGQVIMAEFVRRPNRFIAHVMLEGKEEIVHVKNTGRCRELLLPGTKVALVRGMNPDRKTKYDLISVEKEGIGWVNIDSQASNVVMKEWLEKQKIDLLRPEFTYGQSRIDFYIEKETEKWLVEVKGCTLEIDGIGYFPDAPSDRAIKHLNELKTAVREGYRAAVAYVIAMNGIKQVLPNESTHPAFKEALNEAAKAGVEIWYMTCKVSENTLEIIERIKG